MDYHVIGLFLEELVYEGDEGTLVPNVFRRVEQEHGITCDTFVKSAVWPHIRAHKAIYFTQRATESSESKTLLSKDHLPNQWPEDEEDTSYEQFQNVNIVASDTLRKNVFDLWKCPEIASSSIRLKILSAVATSRYEGVWQADLCTKLNISPKTMFQHLKVFYKYDIIVKFNCTLPLALRKSKATSTSGVVWLKRFFDVERIPQNTLRMLFTQHLAPLSNQILILLTNAKDNVVLESDVKAFCLSFFMNEEKPRLLCSLRQAVKHYAKIRRDLVFNKRILRVKAWCSHTGRLENCLILCEALKRYSSMNSVNNGKSLENLHTRSGITEVNKEKDGLQVDEEQVSTPTEDGTEEQNLQSINIHVASLPASYLHQAAISQHDKSKPPPLETPYNSQTTPTTTTIELKAPTTSADSSSTFVETEPNEDNEEVNASCAVNEITVTNQILCLIWSTKEHGILTPEIATILGMSNKRLVRTLQAFENTKLIYRRPQRIGKHFVYRYFAAEIESKPINNFTSSTSSLAAQQELDEQQSNLSLDEQQSMVSNVKQSVNNDLCLTTIDGRSSQAKTKTEQFAARVEHVKLFIENNGYGVLPDLRKYLGDIEKTNGPDRRTVLRLVEEAMVIEPRIQRAFLEKGRLRSQPVHVFYWSPAMSSSEAEAKIAQLIAEKRSEGCKGAVRRSRELAERLKQMVKDEFPAPEQNQQQLLDSFSSNEQMGAKSSNVVESEGGNVHSNITVLSDVEHRAAAIDKIVQHIEKLDLENDLWGTPSAHCVVLPDVTVEKQSDQRIERVSHNLMHSQKILGRYGFINPLMLRLKLFHCHLIDIISDRISNVPYIITKKITDGVVDELKLFSPLDLLKKMPLITFLRTIGCGFQQTFLDDLLQDGDVEQCCVPMESLPMAHFNVMVLHKTRNTSQVSSTQSFTETNSLALNNFTRLMRRLCQLNLVTPHLINDLSTTHENSINSSPLDYPLEDGETRKENTSDDEHIHGTKGSTTTLNSSSNKRLKTGDIDINDTPPPPPLPDTTDGTSLKSSTTVLWEIHPNVEIDAFTSKKDSEKDSLGIFDLCHLTQFEAYWRCLKEECSRWVYIQNNPSSFLHSEQSPKSLIQNNNNNNNALLEVPYASNNNIIHPIEIKRETSIIENTEEFNDPLSSSKKSTVLKTFVKALPENMSLTSAFIFKNWTAQLYLASSFQKELYEFAVNFLDNFKVNEIGYEPDEETSIAKAGAILSLVDIATTFDQQQARYIRPNNVVTNTVMQHELQKRTIDLSSHLINIEQFSYRLKLPIDAVIRYLMRFFSALKTSAEQSAPNEIENDVAYRCHQCGYVYQVRYKLGHHYKKVHSTTFPADETLYRVSRSQSNLSLTSTNPHRKTVDGPSPLNLDSMSLSSFKLRSTAGVLENETIMGLSKFTTLKNDLETEPFNEIPMKEHLDVEVTRCIKEFQREHQFMLVGIAALAERLFLSKRVSAKFLDYNSPTIALFWQQAMRSVFGPEHSLRVPSLNHPIWEIVADLFPCPKLLPAKPQLIQSVFVELFFKHLPKIFKRHFQRLRANEIYDCFYRGVRPPVHPSAMAVDLNTTNQVVLDFVASNTRGHPFDFALMRNNLKVVLLTPLLTYRPHWASEAVSGMLDSEINFLWKSWNEKGWVVKTKSTQQDKRLPIQRLFQSACGRKYTTSYLLRRELFGKGIEFCGTQNLLKETHRRRRQQRFHNIDNHQIWDTVSLENDLSFESHAFYAAEALTKMFIHKECRLLPVWDGDTTYYDRYEERTDAGLMNLLLSDVKKEQDADSRDLVVSRNLQNYDYSMNHNDKTSMNSNNDHRHLNPYDNNESFFSINRNNGNTGNDQEKLNDGCNNYLHDNDTDDDDDDNEDDHNYDNDDNNNNNDDDDDDEDDDDEDEDDDDISEISDITPFETKDHEHSSHNREAFSIAKRITGMDDDDDNNQTCRRNIMNRLGGVEQHLKLTHMPKFQSISILAPHDNNISNMQRSNGQLKWAFLNEDIVLAHMGILLDNDVFDSELFMNCYVFFYAEHAKKKNCSSNLASRTTLNTYENTEVDDNDIRLILPWGALRLTGLSGMRSLNHEVTEQQVALLPVYSDDESNQWLWPFMDNDIYKSLFSLSENHTRKRRCLNLERTEQQMIEKYLLETTDKIRAYNDGIISNEAYLKITLDFINTLHKHHLISSNLVTTLQQCSSLIQNLDKHQTFFITHNEGLSHCIKGLRKLLGHDSSVPKNVFSNSSVLLYSMLWLLNELANNPRQGIPLNTLKEKFCKNASEFLKGLIKSRLSFSVIFEESFTCLESCRLILRIPSFEDWRILLSNVGKPYCIRQRKILTYIAAKDFIKIEEQDSSFPSSLFIERPIQQNSGGIETEQSYLSSSSIQEIKKPLIYNGGLGPFFKSPEFIPRRLWSIWGPATTLTTLADIAQRYEDPEHFFTHVARESDALLIIILRSILTFVISVVWEKQRTEPLHRLSNWHCSNNFLLSELPGDVTPAASWIQLDGHLNATLIILLFNRICSLIREDSGCATLASITKKLRILDACEVSFLTQCLKDEGIIYSTTQPIIDENENIKHETVFWECDALL